MANGLNAPLVAACLFWLGGNLTGAELTIAYHTSAKDPSIYTSATVSYGGNGSKSTFSWNASGYVERPSILASPDQKLLAVADRDGVEVYEVNKRLIGSLKARKPLASYDLMTLEGESFVSMA